MVRSFLFLIYLVFAYSFDPSRHIPGWQEPGLYRPVWILDRIFYDTNEKKQKKDRIFIKFLPNGSIKFIKKRPLFQIFQYLKLKTDDEQINSENKNAMKGTWDWVPDLDFRPFAKFSFHTTCPESNLVNYDYTTTCRFGIHDPYSMKFDKGSFYLQKKKGFKSFKEVGKAFLHKRRAGEFMIRASPHRPLIGKEFQAFE